MSEIIREKIETSREESFDDFADSSGAYSFLFGQALCLVLALVYHKFLANTHTSSEVRHMVAMVLGLGVGTLTYGSGILHVLFQAGLCYGAIVLFPAQIISTAVFAIAMTYLLCVHYFRAYGLQGTVYNIDISGPLMIATMKITGLGFSLTDGSSKLPDKTSELRKKYVVMKRPTPLEYFSYIFYFQGLLAGPFSFYGDYIAYVEGTNYGNSDENMKKTDNNNLKKRYHPVPYKIVATKLAFVLVWIAIHAWVKPLFSFHKNIDPEFVRSHGILYKTMFHTIGMVCERSRYYIAFLLGDAICNASGFGFNGYDTQGNEKWDLVTNVNVIKTEFATSPKDTMDNWNIQTTIWLRHACFDRVQTQKRMATFILSAVWHGLYPGYYFTFFLGGIFFNTVRLLRKKIRPYFLHPAPLKTFYDLLTMVLSQIAMAYMVGPFILLHLAPTLAFYNSLYWWFHIVMTSLSVILPFVPTPRSRPEATTNGSIEINPTEVK